MRAILTIAALAAVACHGRSRAGPAVRLTVGSGASDTVVINGQRPTLLPVHAIDARGRVVTDAPIRYAVDDAVATPLSPAGELTCSQAGDHIVRASFADLSTRLLVRCRPIEHLRLTGPIQFVLGDSVLGRPREMPVRAYAADGRHVPVIAGTVGILKSEIVTLEGLTMTPRAPGATLAWAHVGEREARSGVHVYQRVRGLDALDSVTRIAAERRLIAVSLRFAAGQFQRQHVPRGQWMLAMLPEDERDDAGVRLRVEGARCKPVLTPRRFICGSRDGFTVVLYRPLELSGRASGTGDLLVRFVGEL